MLSSGQLFIECQLLFHASWTVVVSIMTKNFELFLQQARSQSKGNLHWEKEIQHGSKEGKL